MRKEIVQMNSAIKEQFIRFLTNRKFDSKTINEILDHCEENFIDTLPDLLYYLWNFDYIEITTYER